MAAQLYLFSILLMPFPLQLFLLKTSSNYYYSLELLGILGLPYVLSTMHPILDLDYTSGFTSVSLELVMLLSYTNVSIGVAD